jgi:hypothetical protein
VAAEPVSIAEEVADVAALGAWSLGRHATSSLEGDGVVTLGDDTPEAVEHFRLLTRRSA